VSEMNFPAMRAAMVDSQLRPNNVVDPAIVSAFALVQREAFVPAAFATRAYADAAIPLGNGRAINPPLATARLIAEADIDADDHVLIIGAAGGYACAIAAALGAVVVGVESDPALIAHAKGAFASLPDVTIVAGDLTHGHPDAAPYDRIVIDGAVETVPDAIVGQLRDGGRIVTGIIDQGVMRLARGQRVGDTLSIRPFADCDSVVLPGFAPAPVFAF
jgi:protein-L-isoaspartate(D-aspartate) O-methyltransferase